MCKPLAAMATLAIAISLVGCGGISRNTSRDCFAVWNEDANKARQSTVANRFGIASASDWRAEAGSGTVDLGGPANTGCGYLFHTSQEYLSISGEWRGRAIQWGVGVPPSMNGSWSPHQQATVTDNAAVDPDGLLSHRH